MSNNKFKEVFNKESLIDIYLNYIHYTASTGVDGTSANDKYDYEKEIELILKKVESGKYKFSRYKEKLISKGAGKNPRVISIPTVRDRIVIKALHIYLQKIFPERSDTLIPQVMLERVKNDIANYKYSHYVKVDIKEFYPSIQHEKLLSVISEHLDSEFAKFLLEKAIKNPTGSLYPKQGVPQGLAISNILAEIYVGTIDDKFSSRDDISYSRYVDDVLIFCGSTFQNAKSLLDEIIESFADIGLTCHPYDELGSKTKVGALHESFDFLGYWFNNRTLSVKKESIKKIEHSLAKIIHAHKYIPQAKSYITQYKLNLRITGCIYEGKRRGWIFYYSQMDDEKILYKLDSTVKKMLAQAKLENVIKPKKFSKAYYECKRDILKNHKYIINYDGYSTSQKRELLAHYMDAEKIKALDNNTVNSIFSKRVRHLIKDLEEDIRDNS
ncbi:reverse transcriptase domain-containing protein [Vibrio parahaemolyticus]|jgi:retron-type reverse transcriptase|uniref:reverse transcriptase domain-containing protein n=1 Tax=Vibrio TaxID=662 RepID=UPI0027E4E1A6|nr:MULTISPECIES: reverse transcriptase domain-containing protein [Vibrio]MDW2069585.1 reverse transcriptase domain-containing protein [Vibrio sp. 2096]MDW3140311.1 reverse transcriptase domain-containing protein [Vibrio sp. 2094]WMN92862.1 reverse transcriptase domain-containing protein [Vibrio parahaemolyticus]WMO10484.1 reverse transcriptase domain-containing protein [Vibrio parahaemolyticus]